MCSDASSRPRIQLGHHFHRLWGLPHGTQPSPWRPRHGRSATTHFSPESGHRTTAPHRSWHRSASRSRCWAQRGLRPRDRSGCTPGSTSLPKARGTLLHRCATLLTGVQSVRPGATSAAASRGWDRGGSPPQGGRSPVRRRTRRQARPAAGNLIWLCATSRVCLCWGRPRPPMKRQVDVGWKSP